MTPWCWMKVTMSCMETTASPLFGCRVEGRGLAIPERAITFFFLRLIRCSEMENMFLHVCEVNSKVTKWLARLDIRLYEFDKLQRHEHQHASHQLALALR